MQRSRRCSGHALATLCVCAATWQAGASLAAPASPDVVIESDYIFVDSFESTDCSLPLTCSPPLSGKSCMAGQLTDAATTQPVHAVFNIGLTCGHGAIGGPCDLNLAAFDALQYAADPATSTPLASGAIVVDGCGRFRIPDLTVPFTGTAAIAADDTPGSDVYMPSTTIRALVANQQINGVNLAVTRKNVVASWSLQGQTDFSLGALLLTYSNGGTPTAGVMVSTGGGPTGTIRYFSDADSQRTTVSSSATSTGTNGSALVANAPLATYTGTGGELNGCAWTHVLTTSIPGVVVFAELACVF